MSVDLHLHSQYSHDGYSSPSEIVQAATRLGLTTLSVTEHDSIQSLPLMRNLTAQAGIRYIPGVEIQASDDQHPKRVSDYLIYWFDPSNHLLNEVLVRNRAVEEQRVGLWVSVLRYLDIRVNLGDFRQELRTRYPYHPRPSVWRLKGFVRKSQSLEPSQAQHLFKWVDDQVRHRPQLPVVKVSQLCRAARSASGLVILAHPGKLNPTSLRRITELYRSRIIDGFEVYHIHNHDSALGVRKHLQLARKLRCAISGGSDSHEAPLMLERYANIPDVTLSMASAYQRRYGRMPPD